jgi:hypothetical protein
MYPVPLRSTTMLALDQHWQGRVKVTIYDENGRCVFVALDSELHESTHIALHASRFPTSGVYHVVIESKSGIRGMLLPVVK